MPDESTEEAQQRRAKQAEKRRLAAIKAEEDKARRAARKRRASKSNDDEDNGQDKVDIKSTSKKAPPKRARVSSARKINASPASSLPGAKPGTTPKEEHEKVKEIIGSTEAGETPPYKVAETPDEITEAPEKKVDAPERKVDAPERKVAAPERKVDAPGKNRETATKSVEPPTKKDETRGGNGEAPGKKEEAPGKNGGISDEIIETAKKDETAEGTEKALERMEEDRGILGPAVGGKDDHENEQGGGVVKDEANRKPSAREKLAATTSSREDRVPVARHTQHVKYSKKPSETMTPPRRRTLVKPPFGSPMPPMQHTQRREGRPRNSKDPPAANHASKPSVSSAPEPPARIVSAPTSLVPVAAAAAASAKAVDSSNVALPKARDFSELYAELDRFVNEEDFDDSEDGSDDDDDESDDEVDEDLRQQALQVIAERRDRERIQQLQIEAAAALRRQEEDVATPKSGWARWKWSLIVMVALYYITGGNVSGWAEWIFFGTLTQPNVQVCFNDSTFQGERKTVELEPKCEPNTRDASEDETALSVIQWAQCPLGATCQGGQLLSCPPLHKIHDNWCYLSTETNETIASIQNLLHEWTVRSYCSVTGDELHADTINRNIGKWTGRPFFHYSRVVGELECGYDLRLLYLGNTTFPKKMNKLVARFVLEQDDSGNLWLALHPDTPLKIPTTCQVGHLALGVIFLFATVVGILAWALWTAAQRGASIYYGAIVENTVVVGVATVFLTSVAASMYRSYWERLLHKQRCSAIEEAREKAYGVLKQQAARATGNQDAEVSSSWLCQDLAWKLHEMSRQKRQEFVQQIWPCVAETIARDDRVAKLVRPGGCVEYWKWVEATPSGDRQADHYDQ